MHIIDVHGRPLEVRSSVMPILDGDTRRKPTNVTLPEQLLAEARDLQINVSAACEKGLLAVVAETKREKWIRENLPAMKAWNEYFEEHGLPLAAYRQF